MPDREKVIKGLHDIGAWIVARLGLYAARNFSHTIDEAIALLKEQEAEKPKWHWEPYEPDKRGYTDGFTCSRCERVILSDHY